MKKFLKYLLLIFLFSLWGIILTNKDQTRQVVKEARTIAEKKLKINQPCSKPLTYSIGSIDPKFGISQEELEQLAGEAASIWNRADGKTLLQYDPASSFKINLTYDNRQEATDAASQLQHNLDNLETTDDYLKSQYDSLSLSYKKKIDKYNEDLDNYKNDLEKYNSEVNDWNSQGGAPSAEYDKLKKEKNNLENEYNNLNKEKADINALVSMTNGIAKKENQVVTNYNNTVSTYKEQYGDMHEFEKGVFDGKEINIYQFKADSDLRLTLTHELGHYIGMDHVENSKSIMYYLIGDQDMKNPTPTVEDSAELDKICKLNQW